MIFYLSVCGAVLSGQFYCYFNFYVNTEKIFSIVTYFTILINF